MGLDFLDKQYFWMAAYLFLPSITIIKKVVTICVIELVFSFKDLLVYVYIDSELHFFHWGGGIYFKQVG